MRQVSEGIAVATLSGRDLALQRRKVMALHGKTGFYQKKLNQRVEAVHKTRSTASTSSTIDSAFKTLDSESDRQFAAATNGRSVSRARRNAMNSKGKAAIKSASSMPSGRRRSSQHHIVTSNNPLTKIEHALPEKSCGCGSCNCGKAEQEFSNVRNASVTNVDQIIADAAQALPNTNIKMADSLNSRVFARARRAALAQDGKAGLKRVSQVAKIATSMPDMDWQTAIVKGASGRQVAMQRRLVCSLAGRTNVSKEDSRPSGRTRSTRSLLAPQKVEQGHTLSGHTVTGTMVERSKKVTGNEPGSCRPITGTEYIGAEQFQELCTTQPEPAPAKVNISSTLRNHKITGTELSQSKKITGDEPGSCRNVTGTEYLAAEHFEEFCPSKPAPAPLKVNVDWTEKEKAVTGTSVINTEKVTGNEQGSDRAITGTNYTRQSRDSAPDKVVISHTSHGRPVTGTAVGHTSKITGDESGACHNLVTGTEYLSAEQFKDICRSEPPVTPHKVSVMSSRGNLPVSGTEVGRSSSVTGDEPGSCHSITGTQYYNVSDFGELCNVNGPRKVNSMQTLTNQTVTGTEVGHSPKVTGDDKGGCKPVTGTDYVGANPEGCTVSTPISPVAKVLVDQTWRGQSVTGSYVGRSQKVTGNEYGECTPISGTPYIGRNQYSNFCESSSLVAQEANLPASANISAIAVTGDRPGANGSTMTGDDRGICELITGTPYIGADNIASKCLSSGRFVPRARASKESTLPPPPADFSIKTPARQAQERRNGNDTITGCVYTDERITGPVNKAGGLITGTPEFRHRDSKNQQIEQEVTIAAAQRLTGEGNQTGRPITGDAWFVQNRVTGTEGASSLTRNLSIRGEPRGGGINAQQFREMERPSVPESRITGSAGSATKGAVVTVSGGARA
ncbi:Carboxysome shell peptide mid-region [Nitrosomonas nitrosa]|uniref:Carboxysome shell peptide mid-region n=1 Tax=Nitrosomonas nitrosa TaxID=52442 RepID=A0A1I4RNZ4_9PROT|nr:CsoS2 family carboxysome shell protein [Nitrosomonas nitrosa]SFM53876.1 Carboxysome shell peptide mid-region [Nitrosomonas nitrosa]